MIYFLTIKFGKISYDGFSAVGFDYNAEKDIFYSAKDAWQKNFGYCHLYDVSAPLFCMIIDTEPIKFYYNNKNWLISFWKGQYGMVTGAEIGIYYTNHMMVDKNNKRKKLVETRGLEPRTSCLQSRHSNQLNYVPNFQRMK